MFVKINKLFFIFHICICIHRITVAGEIWKQTFVCKISLLYSPLDSETVDAFKHGWKDLKSLS